MNALEPTLRRIAADLDAERVRWAIVGGLAAGARTEPRFTKDVDVAVAVAGDPDAERLARALIARGYGVLAYFDNDVTHRLSTVRFQPPPDVQGGAVVDLLFTTSGIEAEVVAGAEPIEVLPGFRLPVARSEHLIAMKVLSHSARRPQDKIDIVRLFEGLSEGEVDRSRAAVRLIAERGSVAPGRDLVAEFESLLVELRKG